MLCVTGGVEIQKLSKKKKKKKKIKKMSKLSEIFTQFCASDISIMKTDLHFHTAWYIISYYLEMLTLNCTLS